MDISVSHLFKTSVERVIFLLRTELVGTGRDFDHAVTVGMDTANSGRNFALHKENAAAILKEGDAVNYIDHVVITGSFAIGDDHEVLVLEEVLTRGGCRNLARKHHALAVEDYFICIHRIDYLTTIIATFAQK